MKAMTLRMDEDLWERVEAARGSLPRERWIREALKTALDHEGDQNSDLGGSAYLDDDDG